MFLSEISIRQPGSLPRAVRPAACVTPVDASDSTRTETAVAGIRPALGCRDSCRRLFLCLSREPDIILDHRVRPNGQQLGAGTSSFTNSILFFQTVRRKSSKALACPY